MTDYPSIKPEDVREGDVVRWTNDGRRDQPVTMQGTVWLDENGRRWVGPFTFERRPDLRLVSRPTPPEPPLRVGDWVEDVTGEPVQLRSGAGLDFANRRNLTRIEPPVGWPVGVPEDGGTRWWSTTGGNGRYWCHDTNVDDHLRWADLLAAGGVPALAVTR